MKIVITGALGHIGSKLLRDLAHDFPKAEILLIDNMMTQRFPSLFNLPAIGRYSFIEGDVSKMDLLPHFKDAYVVVHLAAITDAARSFDNSRAVEGNNYQATMNVANACATTGARLILVSSTSVYGTQSDLVSEDCSENELKPQSPYAVTKLKEEKFVADLVLNQGLKLVICRFGTIFGASPGMRFHTAVNKFCWQAVMRQPITVWTTAYDQKRPYLDLFDASRAITFIIRTDLFDGRLFNVLTLNATVRQIVDCIREFVPEIKVSFVDSKIMNQMSYEVSCERILAEGFVFSGNLRRGIGEKISLLRQANFFDRDTVTST
jgi:nucleoside-diphosphate-sugar epimerase